jgi:hypothetical protein
MMVFFHHNGLIINTLNSYKVEMLRRNGEEKKNTQKAEQKLITS